jgi:hypothetical protein
VGDYQRQLFLIDHAGLPLTTVLEQLDMLGSEVVPVLRREFAAMRKPGIPDAPTHASRKAAAQAAGAAEHSDALVAAAAADPALDTAAAIAPPSAA